MLENSANPNIQSDSSYPLEICLERYRIYNLLSLNQKAQSTRIEIITAIIKYILWYGANTNIKYSDDKTFWEKVNTFQFNNILTIYNEVLQKKNKLAKITSQNVPNSSFPDAISDLVNQYLTKQEVEKLLEQHKNEFKGLSIKKWQ